MPRHRRAAQGTPGLVVLPARQTRKPTRALSLPSPAGGRSPRFSPGSHWPPRGRGRAPIGRPPRAPRVAGGGAGSAGPCGRRWGGGGGGAVGMPVKASFPSGQLSRSLFLFAATSSARASCWLCGPGHGVVMWLVRTLLNAGFFLQLPCGRVPEANQGGP